MKLKNHFVLILAMIWIFQYFNLVTSGGFFEGAVIIGIYMILEGLEDNE